MNYDECDFSLNVSYFSHMQDLPVPIRCQAEVYNLAAAACRRYELVP